MKGALVTLASVIALTACEKDNIRDEIYGFMQEDIAWITEQNNSLNYHGEQLPKLVFTSRRELQKLYYGDRWDEVSTRNNAHLAEINAIYDYRVNTIYLEEGRDYEWDAREVLVHELVHYLQWTSELLNDDTCPPSMEPQAYELTDIWVAEHNHPAKKSDPLMVALLAMICNERGH